MYGSSSVNLSPIASSVRKRTSMSTLISKKILLHAHSCSRSKSIRTQFSERAGADEGSQFIRVNVKRSTVPAVTMSTQWQVQPWMNPKRRYYRLIKGSRKDGTVIINTEHKGEPLSARWMLIAALATDMDVLVLETSFYSRAAVRSCEGDAH